MPGSVPEISFQNPNEIRKSLIHHIFNVVLHHHKFDDNF